MNKLISLARRGVLALAVAFSFLATTVASATSPEPIPATPNLVVNGDFAQAAAGEKRPEGFDLAGDASYRYMADPSREVAGWGVALQSAGNATASRAARGLVSTSVKGIDGKAGRWFRFSFRGLPQEHFAVEQDSLYMKVDFLGDRGKRSFDGKVKKLYALIEEARRDLTVNGVRHVAGAAVWRTYSLDVMLPFAEVDELRLSVGLDHGSGTTVTDSAFLVSDFSLIRTAGPEGTERLTADAGPDAANSKLMPVGGRWFYKALPGETEIPRTFDSTNAERLLYHDGLYTAPFAGMTSAWLRAGDKDASGKLVEKDQFIADNVTVSFDATSMIIHSRGLPNHPTGKFPETVARGNPNYIQEKPRVFYIPLNPKVNASHIVTATDNSNHALPMGSIGVAVNGVVFYNPFDMGSQDATNLMDRCCGHPGPDGTYHYHKYPICINSPWMDEGLGHSPLIGWAFDGFPVYGPYEKKGLMAKDIIGDNALNDFNLHFDAERGWHYHVTPGKFPYIIGGYWGTEDSRDIRRPGAGGRRPF